MLHNADAQPIRERERERREQLFKIHEPCSYGFDVGVGVPVAMLRDEW